MENKDIAGHQPASPPIETFIYMLKTVTEALYLLQQPLYMYSVIDLAPFDKEKIDSLFTENAPFNKLDLARAALPPYETLVGMCTSRIGEVFEWAWPYKRWKLAWTDESCVIALFKANLRVSMAGVLRTVVDGSANDPDPEAILPIKRLIYDHILEAGILVARVQELISIKGVMANTGGEKTYKRLERALTRDRKPNPAIPAFLKDEWKWKINVSKSRSNLRPEFFNKSLNP